MNSNINQINAGVLHTQARMAGLTMEQAVDLARIARLHFDLNSHPHRPTVIRLLKMMWVRTDLETARHKAQIEATEAFDAAVAAAFPADWAAACAKEDGKKRREAKRALRHRSLQCRPLSNPAPLYHRERPLKPGGRDND